jgi:lipoprotein-releasing system permease protein
MLTFQRLIARRYFALGKPRSWRAFIPSIVALVLLILVSLASYVLYHAHSPRLQEFRADYGMVFLISRLVLQVVNVLFWVATLMAFRLNIFTAISIYGLFLGAGAMVMVLSIMSGFEHDLKRKILGTNAHVVVTRPDQPFTDYAALRDRLAKLPGVVGATPYLMNEVMISSQSNLSGVVVKGIDPATVGEVTDLVRNTDLGGLEYLIAPEKLRGVGGPPIFRDEPQDNQDKKKKDDKPPEDAIKFERRVVPGVIIGRELARNLRIYLGDDVNIVSPFGGIGPSGAIPKSKPFRVAGVFFSGMFEYDTKYVYITLPSAQKFFNMADEVTGLELKAADPQRTEPIVAAVQKLVGAGYEVQDWKQLNRSLFSALRIEKILMFVLLCFIILVAAFSIIANGTMLVMEKGREVAILKSMGASDGAVLGAFMMLGVYIGSIGTVSGIVIGIAGCLALAHFGIPLNSDVYYITTLPVKMNPYEIATVLLAAMAIALLATLYPAWMAARLRPVEGLRDAQR